MLSEVEGILSELKKQNIEFREGTEELLGSLPQYNATTKVGRMKNELYKTL